MHPRVAGTLASLLLAASCGSTPAPVTTQRARPNELRSEHLRAAYGCLHEPLEELREAAPGLRRLSEDQPGLVGRTYRASVFQIVPGAPRDALERMVRDILEPEPSDFVFYTEVDPAGSWSAPTFEVALRLEDAPIPPGEEAGLHSLAEQFARCAPSLSSHLAFFVVKGGWADAVGESHHGVALVDLTTREVLWIHVFEAWTA